MDVWNVLRESIVGNDIIIGGCAILEIVAFSFMLLFNKTVKKNRKKWKKDPNAEFSQFAYGGLRITNTFFITIISLFPLLGMLGTVFGLLGLDMASGDMDNIKNNFFVALTSTAWGIIFSVAFKFVYAFVTDSVEDNLDFGKKVTGENQ